MARALLASAADWAPGTLRSAKMMVVVWERARAVVQPWPMPLAACIARGECQDWNGS